MSQPGAHRGRGARSSAPPARWNSWWRRWAAFASPAQIASAVAIVAVVVAGGMINILAARHYWRWDWTTGGLYSLSQRTVQTLRSLSEPVQIYVLLSGADPQTVTLRHLLEAYGAETKQLDVRFVDPDRSPAAFLAVQRQFGVVVGKTEAGQIVTDAPVIVARGGRHHFVTAGELVQVDDPEDLTARPRVEQALTGAIRQVLASEAARVCFTSGQAEDSITQADAKGLAMLADRLTKSNYEPLTLPSLQSIEGADEISSCQLVVVAGPKRRFSTAETSRLQRYFERGGNLLLALGPVPDLVAETTVDVGLGRLMSTAGIAYGDDFVFELDPSQRSTHGFGEAFLAVPDSHPITSGLLQADGQGYEVFLEVASSLRQRPNHPVAPTPLLTSSEAAFGMADFFAWARDPSPPEAGEADHPGPLVLAYAAELPKSSPGRAHGARIVVVGASNVLHNPNWQLEELRGTALFVESAVSWLAAKPIALDIPSKPSRPVGLRMTEQTLGSVTRYCLIYVPLGSVLLGVAIALRRRASERRGRRGTPGPKASRRRSTAAPRAATSQSSAEPSEDADGDPPAHRSSPASGRGEEREG